MNPIRGNKNVSDQVLPSEVLSTSNIRTPVILRKCSAPELDTNPISVPTLLHQVAARYPSRDALCVKRDDRWQKITFKTYLSQVRQAAKSFVKLGLEPFQGVAILGFNSPEYFVGHMATIYAGGVATGLYMPSSSQTYAYCLNKFEITTLLVENDFFLQKILPIRDECPALKNIIMYREIPTSGGDILSWSQFMDLGKEVEDSVLEDRLRHIAVNQCAAVMFTTGTVGMQKGVMISHDMLTWSAQWGVSVVGLKPGHDIHVSYMPLAHAAVAMVDIFTTLQAGATVYFAKPDAYSGTLLETLCEVKPTVFIAMPQMYEIMFEGINSVLEAGGMQAAMVNMCRNDATNQWKNIEKQSAKPLGISSWLSNKLLFKVRSKMGMQDVRSAICTGAPVSAKILNYMHSIQLPVHEMFGMSETAGPCAFNQPQQFKTGSIGVCPTGSELSICQLSTGKMAERGTISTGEIVYRGRNVFMGYVNDPEQTRATIDSDGWLHTGDVGKQDDDGFFYTLGRIKETITLEDGRKVFPFTIENRIKLKIPVFINALVVGEGRKFASVLLAFKAHVNLETAQVTDFLLPEAVGWLAKCGVHVTTVTDAIQHLPQFRDRVQNEIDQVNELAESPQEKIGSWAILPKAFCMISEEVTPTLMPRRHIISEKYQSLIDQMYSS